MNLGTRTPLVILAVGLAAAGCGERAPKTMPVHDALKQRLAAPPEYAKGDKEAWEAVKAAYARAGGAPLWLDEAKPRQQVARLQAAIADVTADGLDPARYDLGGVETLPTTRPGFLRRKRYDPRAAAEADVRLSFVAARLARDLQKGRVSPGQVDKHWFGPARRIDLGAIVHRAATDGEVEDVLRTLAPRHAQYEALRRALARYREVAARGGWPRVPAGLKARAGVSDPGLAAVRARLAASGDLPSPEGPPVLDPALQSALRKFQRAHLLNESGLPDAATVAALNVPVERRIRQLEINLERWRWLPEELGDPHILVNVPTYQLAVYEGGRPTLQMRVVAGKPETPTPIFSDTMETIVFSPYWNVPPNILKEEVVPALVRDPYYLARNNMEIVRNGRPVDPYHADLDDPSYRVRQRPGSTNALGHVKFLFPNNFDVYLHDTPADSLFGRRERGYSHGCVRVEKPFELAQWVLREQTEWTPEKIQAAMYSGDEKHVALKRKVPVYIVYHTAWVEDDGTLRFAEDVYGHDERQERLIPASPRPAAPPRDRVASR